MRTVTYQIRHWTDEETGAGDGFTIIEQEVRHATTGDEVEHHDIPGWYATRAEAAAAITELFA